MADSRSEAPAAPEIDRQARVEANPVVRAIVSVLLVVMLVGVLQANLRPSYLREQLGRVTSHYTNAIGLDQDWALFAPQPRPFSLALVGEVTYADGTKSIWRLPRGDNVLGGYWDYRWLKWIEYAVDENRKFLFKPAAEYIARDSAKRGTTVVQVALLRNETPNNPPGQKPEHGKFSSARYYVLNVRTPAR